MGRGAGSLIDMVGVMKKLALLLVALAAAFALPGQAGAAQCGLADAKPLWIDFGDGSVSFWKLFAQPDANVAASNFVYPPQIRAAGAKTVYFDLYLNKRVGTPTAPADADVIEERAKRLFDTAVRSSGCDTPLIALNELFGASTTTPWSPTNGRYRANVLAFLRALAARGARPFLLLSSQPYTGGEAADWWREAAKVADLVPEVYLSAPSVHRLGPAAGPRRIRAALRGAIGSLTEIGIPSERIGVVLGFQSGKAIGGRDGLQPAHAWFEVVKWQTLAAKAVAAERGIATVWTWGWATWETSLKDPDKEAAACVYLWTRDPNLCDGPGAAGPEFNASRAEGEISLRSGTVCSLRGSEITAGALSALEAVTGDRQVAYTALFARLVESRQAAVSRRRVLEAERAVVAGRFRGSLVAYRAALTQKRASLTLARDVLADELRRAQIEARLRVAAPSGGEVTAYYRTYAKISVRAVRVEPAPWWLGGKTEGLALASVAPAAVFRVPVGRSAQIRTLEGTYTVEARDAPIQLGALPPERARAAIGAALLAAARGPAFDRWTAKLQRASLSQASCLGDDRPSVGAVQLSGYLPFLSLDESDWRAGTPRELPPTRR